MSLSGILWVVLAVFMGLWLLGVAMDVAGNLIHLLLVVVALILLYNLVAGRRSV